MSRVDGRAAASDPPPGIDPATYAFYQARAPHYRLSPGQSHSPALDAFCDRLHPGARVLELGCGGGYDADRMRAWGFAVDATDGVPAMVAKANAQHDIGARLMRFDQLRAVAVYDAVWAHACLLHCPRAQLPGVLGAIHAALREGGWHFASFKLGDHEGRDLLGRLHNFPSSEWLRRAYRETRFELVEERIYEGQSSDGTQRNWIDLTVRTRR